MEVGRWYRGPVSTERARQIQVELAGKVSRTSEKIEPRLIAGVDISINRADGKGTGAVVVVDYPGMNTVEVQVVTGKVGFPYVPGLLSFREAPLALAACERLTVSPDLFLIDGQGFAHPRRMGLACHLGMFLDRPTIGCAKSRLCGEHQPLGEKAGECTELVDGGEVIGTVVRTRTGVKPVYVSIGHRTDLPEAVRWVLACCRGYRLPEPSRLAHQAAGGQRALVKS